MGGQKMVQEGSIGRSRTHVLPKTQHTVSYIWNRSIRKEHENQLNSYSTRKDEKTTQRCDLAKTLSKVIHNWGKS